MSRVSLAPETLPVSAGFRTGDRGTHTSRTIMLAELTLLLQHVPRGAPREDYLSAIVEDNVLGKKTESTRKLSAQRLSELYALDEAVPLFRLLRELWAVDERRPILAFLCASARDPLLRMTAKPVLEAAEGAQIDKEDLEAALAEAAPHRFNASILNKIARNAASSWTQSGHLTGRVKKFRSTPTVTPTVTAYALCLGRLGGVSGQLLLETFWVALLDRSRSEVLELARDAARQGWIELRQAGGVIDIGFRRLLPTVGGGTPS